jgi:hypothetical protein
MITVLKNYARKVLFTHAQLERYDLLCLYWNFACHIEKRWNIGGTVGDATGIWRIYSVATPFAAGLASLIIAESCDTNSNGGVNYPPPCWGSS